MRIKILLLVLCCCIISCAHAQVLSFKDTIARYNTERLSTDRTGMHVLGAWGLANIATGAAGYFAARQDEWKYFHFTNAVWGVANTGVAAFSLMKIRKQTTMNLNYQQSYVVYLNDKKAYLANVVLDMGYIGAGLGIIAYAAHAKDNAPSYRGVGRSFMVQGFSLLMFDNIMFGVHQHRHSNWFRIMDEIRVSGSGVGFVHPF